VWETCGQWLVDPSLHAPSAPVLPPPPDEVWYSSTRGEAERAVMYTSSAESVPLLAALALACGSLAARSTLTLLLLLVALPLLVLPLLGVAAAETQLPMGAAAGRWQTGTRAAAGSPPCKALHRGPLVVRRPPCMLALQRAGGRGWTKGVDCTVWCKGRNGMAMPPLARHRRPHPHPNNNTHGCCIGACEGGAVGGGWRRVGKGDAPCKWTDAQHKLC